MKPVGKPPETITSLREVAAWQAVESIKRLGELADLVERRLNDALPPSELSRLIRTCVVVRTELIEAATAAAGNPMDVLKEKKKVVEA